MKTATSSRSAAINMFHGRRQFTKALKESGLREPAIRAFSRELSAIFARLNKQYWNEFPLKERTRGAVAKRHREVKKLSKALSRVHRVPFSKLVSPYVDIKTGEPTELGKLVAMSPELATKLNGPKSELIALMHSLEPELSFSQLVNYSYGAFGCARSGITNAAPGEPLSWFPFGNSVFLSKLAEALRSTDGRITVINLGAGPGALEGMILSNLREFLSRLKIISVEQDKTSLKALKAIMKKLARATKSKCTVLEGDFTDSSLQQEISMSSATPFVVAGYSLHHISPAKLGPLFSWLTSLSWRENSYVQVHDVSGGKNGGGQSPVNRIFFNFMPLFHLSVFHPHKTFRERGFYKMLPTDVSRMVKNYPEFFIGGTTRGTARSMVENGSISIFTRQCPQDYYVIQSHRRQEQFLEYGLWYPRRG